MKIDLVNLIKEYGIEEGSKKMKNEGCTVHYGFRPPINACHYTEDCSHCWKEALREVGFRHLK